MPTVTFFPAEVIESYQDGERLFDIGRRAGVDIETACVGKGTCGLCRVRITGGEEFLTPYTEDEQKHLGNVYFITKVRLSCQTLVAGGDVVVELAPGPKRSKPAKKPRSQTIPPERG